MAGDWIKMRTDLHTDPAVIGIACAVGINEDEVVGKLHRIWSWADIHTVDGNAPSVSVSWIDRYLDVSGFAKAMCDAEWLSCQCDDGRAGVRFPNFDRHNGKTAKTRALTAKRVSKHKDKTNADSVSKVTQTALPREEKRREEKIERVRPTLEEVKAYCRERKNAVDPQKWFDHYTSNGWRVGRNAMKDWKAAVRTWEGNGIDSGSNGQHVQKTIEDLAAENAKNLEVHKIR